MNDVFYITQLSIISKDVSPIIFQLGYVCDALLEDWLSIRSDDMHMTLDFVRDQRQYIPLGETAQSKYDKLHASTIIIVSFHNKNYEQLLEILEQLLAQLGGWVACDDDWNIFYTVSTIKNINCIS